MSTLAAVSVDDNLAAGQAGVAVRTTDDELAGRVHVIGNPVVEQLQDFRIVDAGDDTGHQDFNHVLADDGEHFFVSLQLGFLALVGREDEFVVLGGNDDGIDAYRLAVVVVFNGYLALGVGTEVGHFLAFATDVRQNHQQLVRQVE